MRKLDKLFPPFYFFCHMLVSWYAALKRPALLSFNNQQVFRGSLMIPAHVILASCLIFQVKHREILLFLLHTMVSLR